MTEKATRRSEQRWRHLNLGKWFLFWSRWQLRKPTHTWLHGMGQVAIMAFLSFPLALPTKMLVSNIFDRTSFDFLRPSGMYKTACERQSPMCNGPDTQLEINIKITISFKCRFAHVSNSPRMNSGRSYLYRGGSKSANPN